MTYDLSRFIQAQATSYDTALAEMKAGRKRSHWIWYIFPQLKALGRSPTAVYYGIENLAEAKAYLGNELLRGRLIEVTQAVLNAPSTDAVAVMGRPDDLKLRSCMTLFSLADPTCDVFQKVLDKYFGGKPDELTIKICTEN